MLLDEIEPRDVLARAQACLLLLTALALASGREDDRSAARQALEDSVSTGGPLLAVTLTLLLLALDKTALSLALYVRGAVLLERGPPIAGTSWRPGQPLHNDLRHRMTSV